MQPELAEVGWKPSEFFIPSADEKGHSVRVTAMVTPETKREIQAFIAKGGVPSWRTEGDLVRWSIARGLDLIIKEISDPEVKSAHAAAALWNMVERRLYDHTYWQGMLVKIGEVVTMYTTDHRFDMAFKVLREAEPLIETVEDEYWQKKYKVRLEALMRQVKVRQRRYENDED